MNDLTDAQWLLLDLLLRAKERGLASINRMELLNAQRLPETARLKLVFGALTMPPGLITITGLGAHEFAITDAGTQLYRTRFGRGTTPPAPTRVADEVIHLPGPTRTH